MKIPTGKAPISAMALLAIWSISLVVNLPGLAVTPVLNNLKDIFPGTSQLEIQLLTVLPNLFIIPFVLLSGRLSVSKDKIAIVVVALVIYLASGITYFFARSMTALIIISCTLGVGCGLLIPLAAGLLADTFAGKYRMQQLGIKSGISNIALVAATFVVGWLSHGNWHLPFLVYLIPAIPLALTPFLHRIPKSELNPAPVPVPPEVQSKAKGDILLGRIWPLILVYFFVGYCAVIVSYYSPFLMGSYHMTDSQTGTLTAIFFLAVFLPGFTLPLVVRCFRQKTMPISVIVMGVGLLVMGFTRNFAVMCVAAFLAGYGYGVIQPLVYDKATQTVTIPSKSTLALAFVLTANYVSVSATPFIVDGLRDLFGLQGSQTFPFLLNAGFLAAFAIVVIIFRKSFVFAIDPAYYQTGAPVKRHPA